MRRVLLFVCLEVFLLALVATCARGAAEVWAQGYPEGALGHDVPALASLAGRDDDAELVLACRVGSLDSWDAAGTRFFELRCGGPEAFVISVDPHTRIASWLGRHAGQRVPLTLQEGRR